MSESKFNDPALNAACREVAPWVESFTEQLDKLTADIKALEGYLRESGVRVEVMLPIGDGAVLGWSNFHQAHTWRLVYSKAGECRPLIEVRASERISTRNHLPALLRAVAAKVVESAP